MPNLTWRFLSILSIVFLFSCKKDSLIEQPVKDELAKYRSMTIANLNVQGAASRSTSTSFPQLQSSDFDSTVNFKQYDSSNNEQAAFVTKIDRNNTHYATVIGYRTSNNQYLNIVNVPYPISQNRSGVDIYYIDGTKIGYYEVENEKVVETGVIGDNGDINETRNGQSARSWWGCTRHCIADAHIACYGDSHCMSMLFLSNLYNGGSTAGLGSTSISIACGLSCAHNTNLDLIH